MNQASGLCTTLAERLLRESLGSSEICGCEKQISLTVYGSAVPMARPRIFVDKHNGRIRAANPQKSTDWKQSIQLQALAFKPETLLDGPLEMTMAFYLPRPGSKPKREKYPRWKPDWENLSKAVSDACEGVLYTNDSRIVVAHVYKRYGNPMRVEIEIRVLG